MDAPLSLEQLIEARTASYEVDLAISVRRRIGRGVGAQKIGEALACLASGQVTDAGLAYERAGLYPRAIEVYAVAGVRMEARGNLFSAAGLYTAGHRPDDAQRCYRAAAVACEAAWKSGTMTPTTPGGIRDAAYGYHKAGDFADAIRCYLASGDAFEAVGYTRLAAEVRARAALITAA